MNENAKKLAEQIISFIEEKEMIAKDNLCKEDDYTRSIIEKDKFTPGWVKGIFFSWDYVQARENEGQDFYSDISFHFEENGVLINDDYEKLKSNLDIAFITKKIVRNEIVPILREYLQRRVNEEVYGGFYDETLTMTLTLSATREIRKDDPAHMRGRTWEQVDISVTDENRLEKQKQKIYNLIVNESYKDCPIDEYKKSLKEILSSSVKYASNDLGSDELLSFFQWLIEAAANDRLSSTIENVFYGLAKGGNELLKVDHLETEKKPTDEEISLACEMAILILMNTNDKYILGSARYILDTAKEMGNLKAEEILQLGTGKIPKEIIQYQDENVSCTANDIEKIVRFKVKKENEKAYESMLNYLINLMRYEFPSEYEIRWNYKKPEYEPRSQTAFFWECCAKYPNLFPLMKTYVFMHSDPYDYYSDEANEAAVPVGGYAVFELGRASEENQDIVEYFIANADYEHALSVREFASEYVDQYGLHKDNIPVIVACLRNMDYYYSDNGIIESLKDVELLEEFVEYIEGSLDDYEVVDFVEKIWGDEFEFEEFIETTASELKPYYQKIYELMMEEE